MGPIITPRHSAEGTTEKLDHSGTIFFDGSSDPFSGFWRRVDPEGDEGAFLDFKVEARDFPEKVKVRLQGSEVLE